MSAPVVNQTQQTQKNAWFGSSTPSTTEETTAVVNGRKFSCSNCCSTLNNNKMSIARWVVVGALTAAVVVGVLACLGHIPSLAGGTPLVPAASVGAISLTAVSGTALLASLAFMARQACSTSVKEA